LLSAATLAFEINLTRLFSTAQFYHFAFMIVSLALLGSGASGTALAIYQTVRNPTQLITTRLHFILGCISIATAISILGAYLLTNWMPFDSFSIAWDKRQYFILLIHYLTLCLPFFFTGLAVNLLILISPSAVGSIYAINLSGSAAGCLLALLAPGLLGGEGMISLCFVLAAVAALGYFATSKEKSAKNAVQIFLTIILILFTSIDLALRLVNQPGLPFLSIRLSPYKGLSYVLQSPGAEIQFQRWNAFSRVDRVASSSIHSLPGLSYRFLDPLPLQDGLLVDGDDLSPVILPGYNPGFTEFLPQTIAFQLKPAAKTLILEPRGGLDILTAVEQGASKITAVELNPLIVDAATWIYSNPRVEVVFGSDRSFLRRTQDKYDVIVLSLANSFHPIRSGAYSLAEDYRYTIEAFTDAVQSLTPEGIFLVTRWLQSPPSEDLRTFILSVTSLERQYLDPLDRIVAFRGYNTVTILMKKQPFTVQELQKIRSFSDKRAYDLVYAPGLKAQETNQNNILPQDLYFQTYHKFLRVYPRQDFYRKYPYNIFPPSDNYPFFGHFFKWSQAAQLIAELGKTWQPFGGAGYFILVALLVLAILTSTLLIVLPVFFARFRVSGSGYKRQQPKLFQLLFYFGLIGFAFLLVEIPLLQRFILYLGNPSYAMTTVLFTLLLFSGFGSRWCHRIHLALALCILVGVLALIMAILPAVFQTTLGIPLPLRLVVCVVILSPLGTLMGIPFPGGILWFCSGNHKSDFIPWAWAVNGSASVISAVLAALLALTWGFNLVLISGATCYAAAWLMVLVSSQKALDKYPAR